MTPVNMRMNLEIILSGVVRKLSRIFAHISAKMPTQNQLKKVPIPINFRFRKISRINHIELMMMSMAEKESPIHLPIAMTIALCGLFPMTESLNRLMPMPIIKIPSSMTMSLRHQI